jgi:TonB-dependent receptor
MLKNYYDEDFGYIVPNYGDEDFYNSGFTGDPENIFNNDNFTFNRLGLSEETKPTDSYSADERLGAGYIMAEIPIFIGNHKLKFIGGARLEASFQNLRSFYPISASNSDSTFVDNYYLDLLPSINLIYELQTDMNLRLSVSRTLTRPSLREYAPFTFYDFQFQGDVAGNPNLVRSLIWNYDVRWEWFTNPGEVVSIGVFYKQFENAIEETIIPTSSNFKRTFANAEGVAYNYGVEFEIRKNLGFITPLLNYFSIGGNLALINSQITVQQVDETDTRSMWGQSPYSLNLAIVFNHPEWGTSVNVSYNVFGKRIIQVADIGRYDFDKPHVYELPRNVVDFSINQVISNNIEIKFVAKDVLNEDLIWEQGNKIVLSNIKGRMFSLSFGYKF